MVPHSPDSHLPAALQSFSLPDQEMEGDPEPMHAGLTCPQCGEGRLDYDGLLNLACPVCGFKASGGGGCT